MSATPDSAFGAWLRALREAQGMLLRELAARVKMDPAILCKIEGGKRWPKGDRARALQRALGVDAAEFQRRLTVARFWRECGENLELAIAAATQVQEEAQSAYGVVNKSVKKKK